ncbi:helix-turn-helix domain-containing protein [Planctomycetota bacterium]
MADSDIMTLPEVAEYLKVKERTIYRWAQEGKIPASKLGNMWRFLKTEIDEWISNHKNICSANEGDK